MPNFNLSYHGGQKPESQEAGAAQMKKWQAWLEGLGAAVVNPGSPVGSTKVVRSESVSNAEGQNPIIHIM